MVKIFAFVFVFLMICRIQPEVHVKNNIRYGEAVNDKNILQPLLMDMYFMGGRPKKKSPVAVFVHGGGFRAGDKQQAMYIKICREFAKAGYVTFSINYRLNTQGKVTFPTLDNAVSDVLTAFRWIQAHSNKYGIDPAKMIIVGDSAGGGIVVNTAYSDEGREMIAACIDLWGGLPFSQSAPDVDRYGQPVNYLPIKTGAPPTCIFHSNGDTVIPVSTSLTLANELKAKGVDHEIHIIDSANHYPEYMADQFIPIMITFANRIVNN